MDPLGMAPVTTTMSPEKLSYVAMKFKKMCADIIQLKKKYDFKVVVGGNGAWELAKSDRMRIHGIDTVVVGEADELLIMDLILFGYTLMKCYYMVVITKTSIQTMMQLLHYGKD